MKAKIHKVKTPLSDDKRITKIIELLHEHAREGTKYYAVRQKLLSKGFHQNAITHASYIVSYTALLKRYETKPTNEKLNEHFRKYPHDAALYAASKYKSFEETEESLDGVARFLVKLVFRTPGLNYLSIPLQMVTQMVIYSFSDRRLYRKNREVIVVFAIFIIIFGILIFVIMPASTLGDGFWNE